MQFFEELPPTNNRNRRIDWDGAKADLIANEGKWGLMATNISNSIPQHLRAGRYKAFRGEELDDFEFAVRRPETPSEEYGPRMTDLYGRYSKGVSK